MFPLKNLALKGLSPKILSHQLGKYNVPAHFPYIKMEITYRICL